MNDIVSFLKAVQAGNTDAAGVLADWLDERGDRRGKLLRRRWKRWQKEHAVAVRADERAAARTKRSLNSLAPLPGATVSFKFVDVNLGGVQKAIEAFRKYLRDKFPQESYEASDPENSQAYKDS